VSITEEKSEMIGCRKSIEMKSEVFKLSDSGKSQREISKILGISRTTIRGILENRNRTEANPSPLPESREWSDSVPWDEIKRELKKRYVTVKQLSEEYAPSGIDYIRFWRELNRRLPEDPTLQVRIRMRHEPGGRFEIDYTDGIPIVDRKSGKLVKTQLFASVSSFSDLTFAEFSLKQKRSEFLSSQDRMFHFFGGIPTYIVVDNLKSGVFKAHRYDPDLNPVYCDYANHMGFAVLPARPSTPRDKPAIETAIGVIQRQFYAQVRNRKFYSLNELNQCLQNYLKELNSSTMKDYGVSREERFDAEKAQLRPIPKYSFELVEYRSCRVHPDCHVQVDRCFYSVPYKWVGQQVKVRVRLKTIEVFNQDHEEIAVHSRKMGVGLFSTYDTHYPEEKVAMARLDVISLKKQAATVGQETQAITDELLSGTAPLRYLRRVQGILRLSKTLPNEAVEYGCRQARMFGRLRLQYITDCATQFHQNRGRPILLKSAPVRETAEMFLHDEN
jgi:transposase